MHGGLLRLGDENRGFAVVREDAPNGATRKVP